MAVTLTQHLFLLQPKIGAESPPGAKAIVFGTATLAAGTVEVAVPFGGANADFGVGGLKKVASSSAVSIETDLVIDTSSHAVTFNSSSTDSTADINYMMIGSMDEEAAS